MTKRNEGIRSKRLDRRTLLTMAGAAAAVGLTNSFGQHASAEGLPTPAKGQLVIAQLPAVTVEQYKALTKEVASGGLPKGIITQIVTKSQAGITVVTLWESVEASNKFLKERVKPAMMKLGIKPKVTTEEVIRLYQRA